MADRGETERVGEGARGVLPYQFEPLALDVDNSDSLSGDGEFEAETGRLGNTDWCQCDHCIQMPTTEECCCCTESSRIWMKVINRRSEESQRCITELPGFRTVCLDPDVLETAYLQYKQEYGPMQATQDEKYRYTAYRQLVRWCYGILGRQVRVPLPACAVKAIRDQFSSDTDTFRGFRYPEL